MSVKKVKSPQAKGGMLIQFSITGLVVFSALLLAGSALSTHFLMDAGIKPARGENKSAPPAASAPGSSRIDGPWGELVTYNIELERPEAYQAYRTDTNQASAWVFAGQLPGQVRETMLASGLTAGQVQRALSPERVTVQSSNTIVNPDDDLVLNLAPPVRAKLYRELALYPENYQMQYPFYLSDRSLRAMVTENQIDPATLALVKRLSYLRGQESCFSDIELVLRRLPTAAERIKLIQTLSRESAVLARLRIFPDTDIDRLLTYWGGRQGDRLRDMRSLLESVKRLPAGGTVSVLYLLPPFARQRLYTFPPPSQPGGPHMDCHWSTMNFFNEVPDNRFNDPVYLSKYLDNNYYPIAQPTAYGDLILLVNENSYALHSAIYIAADLVFTKNGDNYLQPWVLMHLQDLIGSYANDPPPKVLIYRNKNT